MNRLMGRNMMRKDGAEHFAERKLVMKSFSQRAVVQHWRHEIGAMVNDEIETLKANGEHEPTELVKGFATTVSGNVLRLTSGLMQVTPQQLDWASQAMINGVANLSGDANIEAECHRATEFLHSAIDEALSRPDSLPVASMNRLLAQSNAPIDMIRNNVKLAISGGQNETRDVLTGCIWAVLHHGLDVGALNWNRVFDEFVRWMAPIGMSPRRIAKDHQYGGINLYKGSVARLMFGIANRDPLRFVNPDSFRPDLHRPQHMAFGAGPHFCAGAFVSRLAIAELALPQFFGAFPSAGLTEKTLFSGWAFRGPDQVKVTLN